MLLENALADFIELLFVERENNTHRLISNQLLSVHYNNYFYNLTRALYTHYPMTAKILGKTLFISICKEYIHNYPSQYPDLNEYGAYFAAFLHHQHHTTLPPYIADIATLEWICHALPMVEEVQWIDPAILEIDLAQSDLLIEFSQAMQLFSSSYPLLKLTTYCQQPNDTPFLLTPEPCTLLIMKTKDGCSFTEMSPAEFHFLSCVLEEIPLAKALEETLKQEPTFQLADTLIKCAQLSAINKVHIIHKID